jgi:hypothetical protein
MFLVKMLRFEVGELGQEIVVMCWPEMTMGHSFPLIGTLFQLT